MVTSPSFVPATNAPLAGMLHVSTDVDSRVSITVDDGNVSWTRHFHDYSQSHSLPLVGFKSGRTNQITVTVYDCLQNGYTAAEPLTFITPALPNDFAHGTVLYSEPSRMEPGYTLFIMQNRTAKTGYITFIDKFGEVVWYAKAATNNIYDVRQLNDGNLFLVEEPPLNRFIEVNMLGDVVRTWLPPAGYPINDHDGVPTDHGTILYLSDVTRTVDNFPSSATDPSAPLRTTNVDDNPVVELDFQNSALLSAWSLLDRTQPTRVSYLTYQFATSFGVDNYHANAVIEDTNDHSFIVSARNQNAVFKFARPTGQLKWILGPHANWDANFQAYLLTPSGTPFQWNYGQHAPRLTPHGTLLLYDNGNARASPYDPPVPDQNNYSRAVEFSIDETNMSVTQVWDTTQANADRLYTGAVGSPQWLPQTGNILVNYGLISYVNGAHPSPYATNATMVRMREYTHDAVPSIVFELAYFDSNNVSSSYLGYICYRSLRLPDLYAHPPMPVSDLSVTAAPGGPRLSFSGDPFRTYTVEASSDLSTWALLGTPAPAAGADVFVYQDLTAAGSTRFYRIVTH